MRLCLFFLFQEGLVMSNEVKLGGVTRVGIANGYSLRCVTGEFNGSDIILSEDSLREAFEGPTMVDVPVVQKVGGVATVDQRIESVSMDRDDIEKALRLIESGFEGEIAYHSDYTGGKQYREALGVKPAPSVF